MVFRSRRSGLAAAAVAFVLLLAMTTPLPAQHRDHHGPSDIDSYIERLLRPDRVAYLQADRIDDNESGMTKATVDTEQRRLTCGLGVLISNMLTLDASLSQIYGKRSIDTLIDERKSYRFVLTAAYRF